MSIAHETRSPVHALLESIHGGADLAAEYPLVFGPRATGATLALADGDEVRAGCALLVREFRVGRHRVRGGLVGSVGTAPAWRGRGLATRLLAETERALRQRGCVFALLWAQDPDFYLERGWTPFGEELDLLISTAMAAALPEPIGVRESEPGDAPHLHRCHTAHATRVERTLEEMRDLLAVPGMRTLVRERDGIPAAYAILGRGRDLAGAIHEWAGAAEDVLALVRAHLEERNDGSTIVLMAPPGRCEVVERLTELGAECRRGILGLGKLLDPARGAALLQTEVGAPGSAAPSSDGRVALRGPRGTAELDFDALQALLFGAAEVRDEARKLLVHLGLDPGGLPLQPFAWGLDSL